MTTVTSINVKQPSSYVLHGSFTPVSSLEDIKPGCRLFYENNHKFGSTYYKTGIFIEIKDVEKFVSGDSRQHDPEVLRWHNFIALNPE